MHSWINDHGQEDLPSLMNMDRISADTLMRACMQYTTIGWDHFMLCRVLSVWNDYYSLTVVYELTEKGNVSVFGNSMINALWKHTLYVWKCKNKAVYRAKGGYSTQDIKCIIDYVQALCSMVGTRIYEEGEWLFRV